MSKNLTPYQKKLAPTKNLAPIRKFSSIFNCLSTIKNNFLYI